MKKLYCPLVKDKDGEYRKPIFAENKDEVKKLIEKYNKTHREKIKLVGKIYEPDYE